MSDLNCPYCKAGLEVCHDDGEGYEEDKAHEMECPECEKYFTFQTSISFYYEPEQADCLNDALHPFEQWRLLWTDEDDAFWERCCGTCGKKERRVLPIQPDETEAKI